MNRPEDGISATPTPYQLFMLALCILTLALLGIEASIELDADLKRLFVGADTFVCGLFLLDFAVCLIKAKNKREYLLKWGWIDLLSSIPLLDSFRWGRAARSFRIIRLLRGVRAAKVVVGYVLLNRRQSVLLAAALTNILLITFASIAVLLFERGVDGASITTAEDALWWSIATATTVGYGDKLPITLEGRAIAATLMVLGIGTFGVISGAVASWFAQSDKSLKDEFHLLGEELKAVKEALAIIQTGSNQELSSHRHIPRKSMHGSAESTLVDEDISRTQE